MVRNRSVFLHRILQGVINDHKCPKTRPFIATYVKKHGLLSFQTGAILAHYLCMKNDVNGALTFAQKLKENSVHITFSLHLLIALTRQGKVLEAYKLVMGAKDFLPSMDVVDYSVIVDGLCKEGFIGRALELCVLARKKGILLNVVVYNTVLNGLCREGCLVEAFRLFDSLEKNNIAPSDVTYGTLIDALIREGFLLDARQLFERMIVKGLKPNAHIYNSLVDGYCKICNTKESLKFFDDMRTRSLEPDEFTVSAIIDGFSREGDAEGALQFFNNAKEKGRSPDFLGFFYLIRGLFSKGRIEEARGVLRVMLQSDSSVEHINRIDNEMENESVHGFLVDLCEQGNVREAVNILNEISSICFPFRRNACFNRQEGDRTTNSADIMMKPLSFIHETSLASESSNDIGIGDDDRGNYNRLTGGSLLCDFDSFYSRVALLCSVGDIGEASKLTKEMICGIDKG